MLGSDSNPQEWAAGALLCAAVAALWQTVRWFIRWMAARLDRLEGGDDEQD